MPRPRNTRPSAEVTITIPEIFKDKMDLALFSPAEGRVPYGAMKDFFTARMAEFFTWKTLNLEAFGYPPGYFIRGPEAMLSRVQLDLEALAVLNQERKIA